MVPFQLFQRENQLVLWGTFFFFSGNEKKKDKLSILPRSLLYNFPSLLMCFFVSVFLFGYTYFFHISQTILYKSNLKHSFYEQKNISLTPKHSIWCVKSRYLAENELLPEEFSHTYLLCNVQIGIYHRIPTIWNCTLKYFVEVKLAWKKTDNFGEYCFKHLFIPSQGAYNLYNIQAEVHKWTENENVKSIEMKRRNIKVLVLFKVAHSEVAGENTSLFSKRMKCLRNILFHNFFLMKASNFLWENKCWVISSFFKH